jgi:glycerophosphoryl diester phosphodiesterase
MLASTYDDSWLVGRARVHYGCGMEIVAHRGASYDAPENTLAAARLAWEQGADALECDVHLTRDGRLAVIHDSDTRRVTGAAHAVAELTFAELRRLDVGRWKDVRFAGERVPSLDELLATVPPGRRVFVEVKGGPEAVPELRRCVAGSRLPAERVVVISFHLATVVAAKESLPRCRGLWIVEREAGRPGGALAIDPIIAEARAAGVDGLDIDVNWPVEAEVVRRVTTAGLAVWVWTIDDAEVARQMAGHGVSGIATNRPGYLRTRLE